MLATYQTDGSLAQALRDATGNLRGVQRDVEELVTSLYPEWSPKFPMSRGWQFTEPDMLDIYDAIDTPAATAALHRAGLHHVTTHDHRRGAPCRCVATIKR